MTGKWEVPEASELFKMSGKRLANFKMSKKDL